MINVLANDTFAPDTGETLTVTALGATSLGGTVTIGTAGANVLYTPKASFVGSETFNYTISDGRGGSATATVTVTVTGPNLPPIAVNDVATVSNSSPASLDLLANDSDPDGTVVPQSFWITSVGATQNGGTVNISSDGKTVTYQAPQGYTGSDFFEYMISDGQGGVASANASINVGLFVPSSLGGIVFLDLNHDGVRQATEAPIAGVTVTLTGPTGASSATQTKITNALGAYQFTNLAPGNYSIVETQPQFLVDGAEVAGSQGGTVQNNTIVVNLAENTTGVNNNFAELRQPGQLRFRDFLARTSRDYALAAVDTTGKSLWTVGWTDLRLTNVTSASTTNYKLDSLNASSLPFTAQVPKTAPTIESLQSSTTGSLLRLNGAAASYSFTAAPTGGAGEGEPGPVSVSALATIPTATPKTFVTTASNGAPATSASNRSTAATDAAIKQLTQGSSTPTSSFSRFSARKATASTSAVDHLMSKF